MRGEKQPSALAGCLIIAALVACGAIAALELFGVIQVIPDAEEAAERTYDLLAPVSATAEQYLPPGQRRIERDPQAIAEELGIPLFDGGDGLATYDLIPLTGVEKNSALRGYIPTVDQAASVLYRAERPHTLLLDVWGDPGMAPEAALIDPGGAVLACAGTRAGGHLRLQAELPEAGTYTLRFRARAVPDMTFAGDYEQAQARNFTFTYSTPGFFNRAERAFKIFEFLGDPDALGALVFLVGGAAVLLVLLFGRIFGAPAGFQRRIINGFRMAFLAAMGQAEPVRRIRPEPEIQMVAVVPAPPYITAAAAPLSIFCEVCGSAMEPDPAALAADQYDLRVSGEGAAEGAEPTSAPRRRCSNPGCPSRRDAAE